MPPWVLARACWAALHHRKQHLNPGAKLDLAVIDAGNPLGEAMDFPGVLEQDGRLSVQAPLERRRPASFS